MYYIAYVTEILVAPLDWPIMSISKNIDSNWRNIMSNIWDEIYHSRVHISYIYIYIYIYTHTYITNALRID